MMDLSFAYKLGLIVFWQPSPTAELRKVIKLQLMCSQLEE